jgi:uncharacterized protein (TIGR03435 family)
MEAILKNRHSLRLNFEKKGLRAAAGMLIASAPLVVGLAKAQTNTSPTFEVASVKPHASDSGFHHAGCSGDRFSSTGLRLVNVIEWAYDLPLVQSYEFPRSFASTGMGTNAYDFQAKAGHPVTESECRLMVQALLADRFKLRAHWESKDAEVSNLMVARGGLKITKALDTDEGTDFNIVIDGRPTLPPPGPGKGLTMEQLANRLTGHGAPGTLLEVADKTGLEGRYKIDLRFSTSLPADGQGPVDPPLDTALARQLGLRLVKHKGSVKWFVVDHIEPPDPGDN